MSEGIGCLGVDRWPALLADALPPDQRKQLERHLETCPACQQRLDQADECRDELVRLARCVGDPTATPRDPALTQVRERLHGVKAPPGAADSEAADLYFLGASDRPGVLGTLGEYEVLEVVGQGGMGVVLKAFEPALNRFVAVKVLAAAVAGSAVARRRFTREARAAAAVCHDHVVAVHGVHDIDGLPYLVMQFVAGESLQERLDRTGPLEVEEVVRIGYQTAAGLAAAHAQGLIHRDIKPANLLLENGVARVKITDFGLARMTDEAGLTQAGVVAGTPEYMAPEQARCAPVDPRADLYSLGAVLYACCTGKPPFRGSTALAVLRQVNDEEPPPLRSLNPAVPGWLEALVTRLLAKDPAERFQSAAEVATLLEGYLAHLRQPTVNPAPLLPPAPGRVKSNRPDFRRRRPRWGWLVAAVLLAAGLFGVRSLLFLSAPSPAPAGGMDFYQDFRGGQAPVPPLELTGREAKALTRPEPGGFRVTLPKDQKTDVWVGLNLTTRIKGDFEITAGYEILQVGQPVQGQGVAFSLLLKTDTPRQDVAELARATRVREGEVYNCARISTDDQGQRTFHHEFPPTSGEKGWLRLTRVGREVTLSAAEGANGEFQELTRYDLGPEDVIRVSARGFTGYAPNLLDLRILDLRVRSTPPTAAAAGPWPDRLAKPHSRPWLTAAVLIGVLVALSFLGLLLLARGRRPAENEAAPGAPANPEAPAPLVAFACPGCGHALKVKAELAGKMGKCPRCGQVVHVPGKEAPPADPATGGKAPEGGAR